MFTKRTKTSTKAIIPPDGLAEYWRNKREKRINNTSVSFDDLLKKPESAKPEMQIETIAHKDVDYYMEQFHKLDEDLEATANEILNDLIVFGSSRKIITAQNDERSVATDDAP